MMGSVITRGGTEGTVISTGQVIFTQAKSVVFRNCAKLLLLHSTKSFVACTIKPQSCASLFYCEYASGFTLPEQWMLVRKLIGGRQMIDENFFPEHCFGEMRTYASKC